MDLKDKTDFAEKLREIARVVQRQIDEEDINAYFKQLQEYPIEVVVQALDLALKNRDPLDLYIATTLPNYSEITAALSMLSHKEDPGEIIGKITSCRSCDGNGWHTGVDAKGRTLAWPCDCLYEAAKKALEKRSGPADARLDFYRQRIVNAYEYHQKTWGDKED